MALLDIYTHPHPILRDKALPVDKVDQALRKLIDDMADTMYDAPGIGLAANQIGEAKRLLVIDLQKPEIQSGLIVLVNPVVVSASGSIVYEEGCLSVPGFFANVKRYSDVVVRALDQDEKPIQITASGLLAVVLQHEIDHLEGKLFIDKMGPIAKDIFRRKWKKMAREANA